MSKKSVETLPNQFLATTCQISKHLVFWFSTGIFPKKRRPYRLKPAFIPENRKVLVNAAKKFFW